MAIRTFPHTVNSRFYGMFYYFPDGKAMYLAHRKRAEVFRAKNGWCIDLATLKTIKDKGITVVGVVCRSGGERSYWVTDIEDFFGIHSFAHFGDSRQRGLPLTRFKLNPGLVAKRIARSMKVR